MAIPSVPLADTAAMPSVSSSSSPSSGNPVRSVPSGRRDDVPASNKGLVFSSAAFSCARLQRTASARVQILPAGRFRALDGRPEGVDAYVLDRAGAEKLIADADARQTPYVIDYEHQSVYASMYGYPAPAAGWFKSLEWVDGVGLFATDVEWTDKARKLIEDDEYRFQSPTFAWKKSSGRITDLISVGLTNTPALDGLSDVANLIAARFSNVSLSSRPLFPMESVMDDLLERLRYFLNLPITATSDDCVIALQTLIGQLGIPEGENVAAATWIPMRLKALNDEVTLMRQQAGGAVPIEVHAALQSELTALKRKDADRERNELITAALSDGRILPATESYWRQVDVGALRQYLAVAQPVDALTRLQSGNRSADATHGTDSFSVPSGYAVDENRLLLHRDVVVCAKENGISYVEALKKMHPKANA